MSSIFFESRGNRENLFRTAYPLKDAQQKVPLWYCCICGEEQYEWDGSGAEDGSFLCTRCKKEEEWE